MVVERWFYFVAAKSKTVKKHNMQILTDQQVLQLRAETKGTATKVHFNNAGASLPPDVVVQTVINYLQEEAQYGGYETEANHKQALDNVYSLIAKLVNADADEIAIVENASTAWGIAFNGIGFAKGDEIVTSEYEYVTNLIGLLHAKKMYGIQIKVVPNDAQGNFNLAAFEAAITPQTKLIAVTHIGSGAGGVLPVVQIGSIARKHNVLYLLDACQSVGQAPVDVKQIGCDFLAVTGRKYLRAPRGTGFLYVRKAVQDAITPLYMDGFSAPTVSLGDYKTRSDARRFELYEKNRALGLGLGKAVEYALHIGTDKIWQRIQYLAGIMRNQLQAIKDITVHDIGGEQCGIVTFSVEGKDSTFVKNMLAEKHINVSVALAKSTLFYADKNHLGSIIRASVHYYNTEEEIGVLCAALEGVLKGV